MEKSSEEDTRMVGRRWTHGLLFIITTVWVIQFGAMLFAGFKGDVTVNAAFMLVAGATFGVEALRRNQNRGGDK